jgi:uncharacterized FlaG/YvyC family protein
MAAMDGLRTIGATGFLPIPPMHGSFVSKGKGEKTDGADEAAATPGETGERSKLKRASIGEETALRISYDKDIGRIVVQVLDKESATVVRQLPSEEVVAFLQRFRKATALLVDRTA